MKTAEKRLMTDRKGVKGVVDLNIQSLKDIKSLCEKNGVELEVVFGSVFIGEMAILETESFYEFLLRTVDITGGLWNFNTYNDLAYNPYNYYNTNHYLYEIGDLMIETMNGGEAPEGFGIYLTPENISSYIEERKSKRKELQEYYKQNNKFPLYDFDHETNYKRDEKLSYMEKTGNRK